jgi:hypothetical protein
MGLFSGLKKIGRGIGRGIKKGVKAFDKFDDWIKLKELAQIGQFIPGVNAIAAPISMAYSGYDVAKNVKEGNVLGALGAGASLAGSNALRTPTGAGTLSLGKSGEALNRFGQATIAKPGFGSQILRNLGTYTGGVANPLKQLGNVPFVGDLASKYQGLGGLEKEGLKFAGGTGLGILAASTSGQPKGQSQPYYPSYQPINYGNIQGFSPTTQLPAQAQGGITGDDWHEPINKLPANYEGWVTEPSIATLGEQGKEAVLPLNKLLPAMDKGGLNYSPGHAIVGEAGPEYVTRLGPGEEHWAQEILDMPAMKNGGVIGGLGKGMKGLGSGLWRLLGLPLSIAEFAGFDPLSYAMGGSLTPNQILGAGAYFGPGTPYPDYESYKNREVPNLGPGAPSAYQNGEQVLPTPGMSETEMIQRMMAGEKLPSIPIPEYIEPESPLENLMRPGGVSEAEFLQFLQGKEPAPVVPTETPPAVPVQQDPKRPLASVMALLDNKNARYWADRDPERYQAMIDELSGGATDPQAAWERVAPFSTGYPAPSNQINSATHYRPKRADEWDAPAIPWGIDESPMAPLMNISRGLTNQQRQEKRNLAQSLIRSGIGGR